MSAAGDAGQHRSRRPLASSAFHARPPARQGAADPCSPVERSADAAQQLLGSERLLQYLGAGRQALAIALVGVAAGEQYAQPQALAQAPHLLPGLGPAE